MGGFVLRNRDELRDYGRPYVVAELNTSHFGNLDTARKMIDAAKNAGCDCVKFQSWSAETLYAQGYYRENPIAKRIVGKFSLPESALAELAGYARSIGVAFSSTPYARREVDFLLERCDPAFVKIASMELNNLPFLDYVARTGAPTVLSTGMGDLDEIRRAVDVFAAAGNANLCILHCVSLYPVANELAQLHNIVGLRDEFPQHAIGYSDHSRGTELATAAVALGACLVEKHFTLDRQAIGMDNQMATEPDEMVAMVRHCRTVQQALGTRTRVVSPAELEQRKKMRRSVVAVRDLAEGTVIGIEDVDLMRPGTGLPPERMSALVGRTLARAVRAGELVHESDLTRE